MNEIREALLNAAGLCETILALRDEVPDELVEGAELVKQQLTSAVQILDSYEGN